MRIVRAPEAMKIVDSGAPVPAATEHAAAAMYATFARAVTENLSAYLRADVSFTLDRISETSFTHIQSAMESPGCFVSLSAAPGDGAIILDFGGRMAMATVELLLGGSAGEAPEVQRPMTEIEQHLFTDAVHPVVSELTAALRRAQEYELRLQAIETDPRMLRTFPGHDTVRVVSFAVRLGEVESRFRIIQSLHIGAMTADAPAAPVRERQTVSSAIVMQVIQRAQVGISVEVTVPAVPIKDLVSLKAGDVLHFMYPLSKAVEASVNGVTRMSGHVMSRGRRRAFVVEAIQA